MARHSQRPFRDRPSRLVFAVQVPFGFLIRLFINSGTDVFNVGRLYKALRHSQQHGMQALHTGGGQKKRSYEARKTTLQARSGKNLRRKMQGTGTCTGGGGRRGRGEGSRTPGKTGSRGGERRGRPQGEEEGRRSTSQKPAQGRTTTRKPQPGGARRAGGGRAGERLT